MNQEDMKQHDLAMQELNKKFRLITLRTVAIWLAVNLAVDIVAFFLFVAAHIELFVVVLLLCLIASTWVMITVMNRWRSIKAQQMEQLLEKAPMGRLKL